jgi:hypothetical protein
MATREPSRRTFLGEDSWFEILQKAVTMAALAFGVWAYFYSVKPVFEKEGELQTQRALVQQLRGETRQLKNERSTLQQRLERSQALSAANDEGLVFWHLAEMRRYVEEEARSQTRAAAPFDLRDFSLAYARAVLRRLGRPAPGSPESYQKEAAEFFHQFVVRTVPPKEADVSRLGLLLDAYAREGRRETGAP